MFTGIVEGTAELIQLENLEGGTAFVFKAPDFVDLEEVKIGDSIAINGVCLTVTEKNTEKNIQKKPGGIFSVTAVPETLRLTNLGNLILGQSVNFERSMQANSRIGGHWVQGHIDGVIKILSLEPDGVALNMVLSLPENFKPYLIHKGFVGLDGMSLTVAGLNQDSFWVTLIPHTREITVAKDYQIGSLINFEADMMAKYVERMMEVKYARV